MLLKRLFYGDCTHCLPPVAGSSTYLSKYNRTSLSLSSGPGRAKFTISSIRSFMAQSNCSGWLLARTSMNLQGRKTKTKNTGVTQMSWEAARRVKSSHTSVQNVNNYLLLCSPVRYKKAFKVALRSSLIFSCTVKAKIAPCVIPAKTRRNTNTLLHKYSESRTYCGPLAKECISFIDKE